MAQFILLYVFQPLLSISVRAELHTRCMLCDTVGATPCGCPLCKYIILRQNLVLNLLPKAHIPPALSALASVSDGRIIATAAVKQAFAECIIKSQCLFRADNICPYGWRMHAAFDVVGAAVYPPARDGIYSSVCTAGTLAKRYLCRRRFPRKKVLATVSRCERVYKRTGEPSVPFCEKEE